MIRNVLGGGMFVASPLAACNCGCGCGNGDSQYSAGLNDGARDQTHNTL